MRRLAPLCCLLIACTAARALRPDALAAAPLDVTDGSAEIQTRHGRVIELDAPVVARVDKGMLKVGAAGAPLLQAPLSEVRGVAVSTPPSASWGGLWVVAGFLSAGVTVGLAGLAAPKPPALQRLQLNGQRCTDL